MPCRDRMLSHLLLGSGMEVALPATEGPRPWEAGMHWLVHRAQAPSSLRAGDKRGHACQLVLKACLCFPRQTRVMFNQPTDVEKLCLLFRAADPTELMGEGGCSHRFTERSTVKVTASLPATTLSRDAPGGSSTKPRAFPRSLEPSESNTKQLYVLLGSFINQLTGHL